jgi:hypothetical protein
MPVIAFFIFCPALKVRGRHVDMNAFPLTKKSFAHISA